MRAFIVLLFISTAAFAVDAVVYPTLPDGSRDYRGPNYAIDGSKIYQTMPDGSRDYRKPVYVISGDKIYKTMPDGSRDYRTAPATLSTLSKSARK